MNTIFNSIIKSDDTNLIELIITPLAPYFMCDHYISTEIHGGPKYVNYSLHLKANDLIRNKNYDTIKQYDIIQVQVDYFDFFYEQLLPFLKSKNIKIILLTSQWHIPQITRSEKTDTLLKDPSIHLWISQNPIYMNNPKYIGIPYGILHHNLDNYIQFIRSNKIIKTNEIQAWDSQ